MKKKLVTLGLCILCLTGCGVSDTPSEIIQDTVSENVSGNEIVGIQISEEFPENYETVVTLNGLSPILLYTQNQYVIYADASQYDITCGNLVTDTAVSVCKLIAEDGDITQDISLLIDVEKGPDGTDELVEQTYQKLLTTLSEYLITNQVYGISLQTNSNGQLAFDEVSEQIAKKYSEELSKRVTQESTVTLLNQERLVVKEINANIDLENIDHEHDMQLVASDTTMISPCKYEKWGDYQCSICGYTEEKVFETFTTHTLTVIEEDQFPTCTEDGYKGAKSCICGEVTEPRIILPAYGHQYEGEVESAEMQTITEDDGTVTHILTQHWISKCKVCGEIEKTWDITL